MSDGNSRKDGASPGGSSGTPPDRERPEPSIERRALQGSAVVIAGYALSQLLRLGGNLVLTRLLFPEVFGLMVLVQVVITGVSMFSDVGMRGSIVYHERGEDPAFLNTAWTLQIIRGLVLWLALAAIVWPFAAFYDRPELLVLAPVAGLSAIIDGLASTARYTLIRRIAPARQVGLELAARAISLCVMIPWALIWPSVWALVAGALVMSAINAALSHMLIPGYANRLMFDRPAFLALFRYGRWILLSTALAFLLAQADRLFLGKLLSMEQLGVYSIAVLFAEGILSPVAQLASSILQPFYARLAKGDGDELRRKMFRARALLLAVTVPGACVLAVFGPWIIRTLYDERYWEAGWMLRILSVGLVGSILAATSDRAILAVGDSWSYLMLQILRSILLVAGMAAGVAQAGLPGLLIGLACARLLAYVPLVFFLQRQGVWLPKLDLPVLGLSAGAIGFGIWAVG